MSANFDAWFSKQFWAECLIDDKENFRKVWNAAIATEGKDGINKEQTLELLMLLSALESWSFSSKTPMPDYLEDRICSAVNVLSEIMLSDEN